MSLEKYPNNSDNQNYYFPGSKTGVVLVHGFTGSPAQTRELGEFFANQGLTVCGVRLVGHGVHHEILKKTNRFDWYYSLKTAVEKIREQVDEVFLIGFSMGGNLSLLFNELAGGVKGLILVNTPIYTRPSRLTFWFIPLIKRFKKYKTKEWAKEMDNYFFEKSAGSYPRIPLESAWQFYKLVQETKEVVPKVNIPVYVIQSARDEVINAQSAEFLKNKLKNLKHFDLIDTEIHGLLTEYPERERIFEKIYNFIRENSGLI